MYPDKTTDKIMIPQERYNELLKLEGKVDVLLYLIDQRLFYIAEEDKPRIIKLLTMDRKAYELPPVTDDLADALQYSD